MYYVITNAGVRSGNNLAQFNRRYHCKMEQDEFTVCGRDFICKQTNQDIDFVQDKLKMENMAFASFFRKDNSVKFMTLFVLIFEFLFFFILNSKIGG